jgi:hypothetical protein
MAFFVAQKDYADWVVPTAQIYCKQVLIILI